jgi:hypothetical protein
MANTSTKLIDSNKRVLYSFTSDSAETRTIKIDAGKLNYTLNANGFIDTTGTDRQSKYSLLLTKAIYSVNGAGLVTVSTNGDAVVNTILQLGGAGTMAFTEGGQNFVIDCAASANSTGNVFVGSTGPYTLILDFNKDRSQYDQGQTAMPTDFNR